MRRRPKKCNVSSLVLSCGQGTAPVECVVLNEFDNSKMCSTSSEGMDVEWMLDAGEAKGVLEVFFVRIMGIKTHIIFVFMCRR
jgi:hypothetical protein